MSFENFEGFCYVDISSPMVAWNVVRGSFYSASRLPEAYNYPQIVSFAWAGMLRSGNASRLASELLLERYRARYFPDAVSRLTGMFVFDDAACALRVTATENWGGHFIEDNLTDIGVSADHATRMDAQWIGKMMDSRSRLVPNWENFAENYWSGKPASENPLWECLVEGWFSVWGTDLKERAFDEIKHYWPKSVRLLEYAANAAYLGSCDGAIFPILTRNAKCIEVKYHIRLIDAQDPDFLKSLTKFLSSDDKRITKLNGPKEWRTPDLGIYSFEREVEGQQL